MSFLTLGLSQYLDKAGLMHSSSSLIVCGCIIIGRRSFSSGCAANPLFRNIIFAVTEFVKAFALRFFQYVCVAMMLALIALMGLASLQSEKVSLSIPSKAAPTPLKPPFMQISLILFCQISTVSFDAFGNSNAPISIISWCLSTKFFTAAFANSLAVRILSPFLHESACLFDFFSSWANIVSNAVLAYSVKNFFILSSMISSMCSAISSRRWMSYCVVSIIFRTSCM